MQLGKLKYPNSMLLDMVLAGIYKVANPGAPFIIFVLAGHIPKKTKTLNVRFCGSAKNVSTLDINGH